MRHQGKDLILPFIHLRFVRVKCFLIVLLIHFITRNNQEDTEYVKYPMEPFNQRNTRCNKYHPEYDRHQYSEQQDSSIIFFIDGKSRKDEDKHKDVIYAQAPFHQVSTEVLKPCGLPIFYPHKNKKPNPKPNPEIGLIKSFPDGDRRVFFTQQAQV